MIWGAFVSGLDGGAVFNTFPYDGRSHNPAGRLWRYRQFGLTLFENIGLVQWMHHLTYCTTVAVILTIWWRERASKSAILNLLAIFAVHSFCLSVFTILSGSSIYIAWAHQGGAMVLFSLSLSMGDRQTNRHRLTP